MPGARERRGGVGAGAGQQPRRAAHVHRRLPARAARVTIHISVVRPSAPLYTSHYTF